MRYRFFSVVVICILFTQLNFAQNYQTIFGSDTTQWDVNFCQLGQSRTVHKIAIEDTLINGLSYYKVGEKSNQSIDYNLSGNVGITNGFLREDTSLGKIWFIGTINSSSTSSLDTIELLVADLSLSLGDTFVVRHDNRDSTVLVDSVYYESGLKRVRLNYVLPAIAHLSKKVTFLEGIGTNFGFAYMHATLNLCPCLDSYRKNSTTVYSNFACSVIGSTSKVNEHQQAIRIAPHPIQHSSLFSFKNPTSQEAQLIISDISGRTVQTYTTTENNLLIQKERLSGLYFYQLRIAQQHNAQGKILFLD
ncbi:T9SS type A sorting domain-containing protein [Aureispira sp. CCB-E]|uniref:T9SS type A sorting domain-containing protein n=1 Tax=Aureispira sp. CCB-E TaxID=3051121 RepID=UPI0028686296|nr:T9SS type A sorting domain-containing protein [Aureispira sp. CCB-E]WMX12087.1 T9SS type A sorting domain-containing protein [Aureispira sp. CCB-E]